MKNPQTKNKDKKPTLSTGTLTHQMGLYEDPGVYRTSIHLFPGNSGGPLFNMKGEVIGMVTAALSMKNPLTGATKPIKDASCALKIDVLKNLAAYLGIEKPILKTLSIKEKNPSRDHLYQKIRHSVLMVLAI
jgi:serine protease Do